MTPTREACSYLIFGATGNLSRVKLMPALYHLERAGKLPEGSRILALGRRDWDRQRCIDEVRGWIDNSRDEQLDGALFDRFASRLDYFRGDLADPEMYRALARRLQALMSDSVITIAHISAQARRCFFRWLV